MTNSKLIYIWKIPPPFFLNPRKIYGLFLWNSCIFEIVIYKIKFRLRYLLEKKKRTWMKFALKMFALYFQSTFILSSTFFIKNMLFIYLFKIKKKNLNILRLIGRIPPFVSQISDTPVSRSAGSKCYLMTAVCCSHTFFICYTML